MIKLIVGLGNPGKKYENTRHNVGFKFVDFLQTKYPNLKYLKPQDFMNNSGLSVAKEAKYFQINPDEVLVVHDDLDIGVGEYRLQFDRGSAGHNGIKSIVEHLQTQAFWRLRIGIGRPNDSNILPEDYVLMNLSSTDFATLSQVFETILANPDFQKLLGH